MWQSWWVKKGEEESRKEKRRREDEVSAPERETERACKPEGNQLSCGSFFKPALLSHLEKSVTPT